MGSTWGTGRTTRGCKVSLTSSRARSSPTRSRSRRLRRSLLSTWPSIAKSSLTSLAALSGQILTSRPSPRQGLVLVVHPLDPCNEYGERHLHHTRGTKGSTTTEQCY